DQDLGSGKLLEVIARYSRHTPVDGNLNIWPSLVHHCRPSKAIVVEDYDEVFPQTPIEQPQQPQQHQEVSSRRSIRERGHAIPNDYIIFFQEHEDDIGLTKDDPINFCQAMHNSNSQKWTNTMKDEMKSMLLVNGIINFIKSLPHGFEENVVDDCVYLNDRSLMYVEVCTRPDIVFVMGVLDRIKLML
ncbi:hypothetical protein CR513_36436, partial [Mucuna pruriens]